MAAIYLTLSKKKDTTGKHEILIRFKHNNIAQRARTNIFIEEKFWDDKTEQISAKRYVIKQELRDDLIRLNDNLNKLTTAAQASFNNLDKKTIAADWLIDIIDRHNFPEKYIPKIEGTPKQSFFDAFDEFMTVKKFSEWRNKAFKVVIRTMKRYEMYVQLTRDKSFSFDFDNITPKILSDFDTFLKDEHKLFKKHPEIYKAVPESRTPEPRGQNTINGILTKVRTFFIWAVDNEKTKNNPFRKYQVEECTYGTPYYISIEERNYLCNIDLSHNPSLEKQRDIFIFQCLVGCRVADLYRLTKQNIINGAIEYIARKTRDGRPITVRVPLNAISKAILEKYANFEGKTLLPYISEQKYNIAIKNAFKVAGLTRNVTILDPLTRESVVRPLNEIASSHLARRCFVGNLYKQVKDPNLVGVLSGHKEGSKAFARYREIDDNMKNELVKLLE